ncbi:hypothetical protein KP509_15G054100 [Ceratopteris richardii]|uniref:DUF7792 domain-containing protein n=1 Tax=Ceratopteris richardii TaxID=49495 RepID=A0A8T2T777_CERRI|nr:hypothetical protein KP509_15G054100 [Ceratopteris richardii]
MEKIEDTLTVPIQLTDELRKLASQAGTYRQECGELMTKAESLGKLVRLIARGSNGDSLCMRPMRRIIPELEKSLNKALILVRKCRSTSVVQRVMTILSASDFKRVNHLLDNAIADITWLLNISGAGNGKFELTGLPPIASSEPMMSLFWENIAILERGTEEQKEDAASSLGLLARDNDRLRRTIVEEGAVIPLVKVLGEGTPKAKEAAALALRCMAKDADIVKQMIADGIAPAFVKVLINAPMRLQIEVTRTLCEVVDIDPSQQDTFMEHQAIRPLVGLLGESLEEPEKMQEAFAIDKIVTTMAANKIAHDEISDCIRTATSGGTNRHPQMVPKPGSAGKPNVAYRAGLVQGRPVADHGRGLSQRELSRREREGESAEVKAELKAEVARALCLLVKGNSQTSRSVTETKALLCFATLMDKWKGAVRFNSMLAVAEIAAVAEADVELRRAAFKTTSPAARAVVEQLLRLAEASDEPSLQIPSIHAIGCLSRTFPARETRVVKPLVRQLESPTDGVAAAAVVALEKFACTENFLHKEHSQAIVEAGGAPHIVQIIYFGENRAKVAAAALMCYLALHVGESEALALAEPLPALKGFSKSLSVMQYPYLEKLLPQAMARLQIFQDKGTGSHTDISLDF